MEKSDFITWAKKLAADYVPSDRVRRELQAVELVAIVGPTGAGKTTIMNKLGLQRVLSDVSRTPREGEKDRKDYFFRDDYPQMLNDIKQGEYVQFLVAETDEFYGTRRRAYPSEGRATMAIRADQIELFKSLGFGYFYQLYIMPPGYVEWMHRIGDRGDTTSFERRLEEAKKSLHTALSDDKYIFILNDSLDLAMRDIHQALSGNVVDEHRQDLARQTAGDLLEKLGDDSFDLFS